MGGEVTAVAKVTGEPGIQDLPEGQQLFWLPGGRLETGPLRCSSGAPLRPESRMALD